MAEDFTPANFDSVVFHPVQSYAWGEFRHKMGSKVERFVVGGRGYTVTFHRLPVVGRSIGVLTQCWPVDQDVLAKLAGLAAKHSAISVKIEPYTYVGVEEVSTLATLRQTMTDLGLTEGKPLYPRYSFVVDLTADETTLLSRMKSKTRYNVRLAEKKGVQVVIDEDDSSFNDYLRLLDETTSRQGFYAHGREYQMKMWQVLKPTDMVRVARALYQGEVLAAFVLFRFGKRLYYPYGASTRRSREVMAPQKLMWEVMRWGKQHDCDELELWGSLGPNADPGDSWSGFHRFKEGFGGRHVAYVGAYDMITSPVWYRLFAVVDAVRWWWLKLRN